MSFAKNQQFFKVISDKKATVAHKIFMEYLCLSPSYELARKVRSKGRMSQADQRQIPQDFDQVLALYDLLGDVRKLDFAKLFEPGDREVFGDLWRQPHVLDIEHIRPKTDLSLATHAKTIKDRERLINDTRMIEGLPPAVLLHVPLNIPKGQAIKQVIAILSEYEAFEYHKSNEKVVPKIQFAGQRLRADALINGLRLIRTKALNPTLEQWKLGAVLNLSKKHSAEAAKNMGRLSKKDEVQRGHREVLYRLAHRALKKAEYTAENAARGRFPDDTKIDDLEFDYKKILAMTTVRFLATMKIYEKKFEANEELFPSMEYAPAIQNYAYLRDDWMFYL